MLNLLGASKEDFKELMKQMNYKYIEEKEKFYFKYTPKKTIEMIVATNGPKPLATG